MTGICYFSDKANEYFAEMQVKSIAEQNDVLLKESGDFSPEKADKLLNEAIMKDCDKIVFLTEEANVNTLSRLIPQEYGQYFEDIQVIPENFYRIKEAGEVAAAATTQTANTNAQAAQQTDPNAQNQQQQQKAKSSGDHVVILSTAGAPNAEGFKVIGQLATNVSKAVQAKTLQWNGQTYSLQGTPKFDCWLTNVNECGLTASGLKTLYGKHTKFAPNAKFFTDTGWDLPAVEVAKELEQSQTVLDQFKVYLFAPKSLGIQSTNNVIVLPYDGATQNKENSFIANCILELMKAKENPKAEIKRRNDLEKDEDKYNKEFNENKGRVQYISSYVVLFDWWTKNKSKKYKTKEIESKLAEEIDKFLKADFVNVLNKLESGKQGAGVAFMTKSLHSMYNAAKQDLKNATKEKETDEKNTNEDEKLNKKIFEYEKYKDLCKALEIL